MSRLLCYIPIFGVLFVAGTLTGLMLLGASGHGPLAIGWTEAEVRLIARACFREFDGLAPDPKLPRCR